MNLNDSEEINLADARAGTLPRSFTRSRMSRVSKESIGLKFNPVRFLAMALKERARDRELLSP